MDNLTLHDAAARLVALEPDDREGLLRLCDLLQQICADNAGEWPPALQEVAGRGLWRLMDGADGDREGFLEAGECIERALELLEGGQAIASHGPTRESEWPDEEVADEETHSEDWRELDPATASPIVTAAPAPGMVPRSDAAPAAPGASEPPPASSENRGSDHAASVVGERVTV